MSSYYDDPHQNPYWQNLTGNRGEEPQDNMNRQNTRSTDPNWHPEPELGRQLARTAGMFGAMSIITCFFLPLFVPAMLGGTAIILAIISRGRSRNMGRYAKHAVILGTIGLVINLALAITVGVTFYQMIHNPSMREQANQITEQLYGRSFDEILEEFDAGTGLNLENGNVSPQESDHSGTENSDANSNTDPETDPSGTNASPNGEEFA